MPIIKKTLAEIVAQARPFTPAEQARFAAMAKDDSLIDFSDQENITPEKIAAGHYVIVGRGGPRPGAGRKPTGNRAVKLRLPPGLIRSLRAEARREGTTRWGQRVPPSALIARRENQGQTPGFQSGNNGAALSVPQCGLVVNSLPCHPCIPWANLRRN